MNIPIAKPSITEDEIEAVRSVLMSGNIAQSKKLKNLKRNLQST